MTHHFASVCASPSFANFPSLYGQRSYIFLRVRWIPSLARSYYMDKSFICVFVSMALIKNIPGTRQTTITLCSRFGHLASTVSLPSVKKLFPSVCSPHSSYRLISPYHALHHENNHHGHELTRIFSIPHHAYYKSPWSRLVKIVPTLLQSGCCRACDTTRHNDCNSDAAVSGLVPFVVACTY